MAYCIYLRKSRADEEAELHGEGETLLRHERILLDLAKRQKLNITEIYREVVSGETISSRPVMQKLLSEIEQGCWEGVLVMEVERLARGDTIDQGVVAQAFKYSDTKIITPSKTYDPTNEFDEEYFEFGLFMSRREYKTITRRLQRGRLTSIREGKFVGNRPPYGYLRKKLEQDKGFTLTPHPEQAPIVKLIFDLYTRGEQQPDGTYQRVGPSLIANKLNDMGAPSYTGGDWVPATIHCILRNPAYIGKVRWNWRPAKKQVVDGKIIITRPRAKRDDWTVVDGLHDAIISADTWRCAQEILAQNPPLQNKRQLKNPLAGLVICGKCGRRIQRKPFTNKGLPAMLLCAHKPCDNIASYLYLVEERILQALREWLEGYKVAINNETETDDNIQKNILEKSIQHLETEMQTLDTQMSNLHDLLEQGIYSTDTFLERSKLLNQRMEETEANLGKLKQELQAHVTREIGKTDIIPRIEHVLDAYDLTDTPAQKNKLLKSVLEKVEYTKTPTRDYGRWSAEPDDFRITLYPKLPKLKN